MSVTGIGDDDDKEMEYYLRCTQGELNGMYLSSARQGNWPRIEKLLEAGAELDYGGGAALTAAIDGDHVWLARKLVALGVNTVLSKQEALSDAAFANRIEGARFLIDEVGADPAFNDSTVLFTAVVNNHPDMVRLLLEKGANVNANAGTLLDIALSRSFEDVAVALLDGGGDPRKNFLGKNAFEWAAEKHLRAVAARLRDVVTDVFMSPGFFKRQTIAELRVRYDERQQGSGILLAAEAGCFDVVRDKFIASIHDRLARDDLTRKEQGRNALTALGEAGELALAFDPRLWVGRKEEAFKILAKDVPETFRDQVDADALAAEIDRQALKSRAQNVTLKLKIPKL